MKIRLKKLNVNQNEHDNENDAETKRRKQPTRGWFPRADSAVFISVFVFVAVLRRSLSSPCSSSRFSFLTVSPRSLSSAPSLRAAAAGDASPSFEQNSKNEEQS